MTVCPHHQKGVVWCPCIGWIHEHFGEPCPFPTCANPKCFGCTEEGSTVAGERLCAECAEAAVQEAIDAKDREGYLTGI